jgi:hypothetical protein
MRRMFVASIVAGAIAAIGVIALQAQQQPETPLFTKAGWWIRVDGLKTDAASITLQVGTKSADRRAWRAWRTGDAFDFDVPADLQTVKELYLQASANPGGKNTRFCVYFQNVGIKRFDFSGDKDEQIRQSDRDGDCR